MCAIVYFDQSVDRRVGVALGHRERRVAEKLLNAPKIRPAVAAVKDDGTPRNSKNSVFVEKVAAANVRLTAQQIREKSPVLRDMLDAGEIGLIGGMYDLATGQVTFYPDTAVNVKAPATLQK